MNKNHLTIYIPNLPTYFRNDALGRGILRTVWKEVQKKYSFEVRVQKEKRGSCSLATAVLGAHDSETWLCKNFRDWQWSSYHRYRRLGIYSNDRGSNTIYTFGNREFGDKGWWSKTPPWRN